MKNVLEIRNYSLRDSRKDIFVSTDTDILDSPVRIKVLADGLQIDRAGLDDKKTYKLRKVYNKYETNLSLVDLEAGIYELVEEESDGDRLVFRLPE